MVMCLGIADQRLTAQSLRIDSMIAVVDRLQEERLKTSSTDDRDSLFSAFYSSFLELVSEPEICSYEIDYSTTYFLSNSDIPDYQGGNLLWAFMNYIVVTASDGGAVRILSVDGRDGGPYHTYTSYLLFRNGYGNCTMLALDTATDEGAQVEVGYYDIETALIGDTTVYILFGYGSYGGGKQHHVVRFMSVSDSLTECFACYPDGKMIVVETNRGQDPMLKYDQQSQTLTYLQFKFDEDHGFFSDRYQVQAIDLASCIGANRH